MTIKIKWKTRPAGRGLNYYRSRRDKRLFEVFNEEPGMLKSTSYAIIPTCLA